MRFLLAPDSFKESLSAGEAARAMERGVRLALPQAETVLRPVADGGEGTLEVLQAAFEGSTVLEAPVRGPLGKTVLARFAVSADGGTAIVESALASGLGLVPRGERDVLRATSWGTGELIRMALDRGARHLIVGLGGSATSDGGAGALQALGARLLDPSGREVGPGGGGLGAIDRIDPSSLDPRLGESVLEVACDVTSPLLGPQGASALFARQKGATPEMVVVLERNLGRFAELLRRTAQRDVQALPGSGAAGGLGACLASLGGRLVPGVDLVLDKIGFDQALETADIVFTGEGRIDAQTLKGKAVHGVVRRAARWSVPVVAFSGAIAPGFEELHELGLVAAFPIAPGPMGPVDALRLSGAHLERAAGEAARLLATQRPLTRKPLSAPRGGSSEPRRRPSG